MTTRLDLRLALRRKLEDTGAAPLWDDVLLNEALWNSLVRFGVRIPLEATASVAVSAGATTIPVVPVLPRNRVLRVIDARGEMVPEAIEHGPSGPGEARCWRWWNGSVLLSRALGIAETWTIEYRANRTMPADDTSAVQIQLEDEPILIAMAAEVVLRRRAVEEMKRNGVARVPLADPDHPTVQVALSRLSGGYYTDQALVMAGTLLGTVPLVLVFVLFGRQIIGGIMEGGVKQ